MTRQSALIALVAQTVSAIDDVRKVPRILPLRYLGDPILEQPTPLIEEFDRSDEPYQPLAHLATLMELTRQHWGGVGLAAPQVGFPVRMAVIACENLKTIICNPIISNHSGLQNQDEEGCLSVPGYTIRRARFEQVTVQFQDIVGIHHSVTATGYLSRCLQHEVDHLDGKLFIDVYKRQIRRAAQRAVDSHLRLMRSR